MFLEKTLPGLRAGGTWWYNGRKGAVEQIGLALHDGEDLGF